MRQRSLAHLEQGLADALALVLGQHKEVQDAERLLRAVGIAAVAQEEGLVPHLQQPHQAYPTHHQRLTSLITFSAFRPAVSGGHQASPHSMLPMH